MGASKWLGRVELGRGSGELGQRGGAVERATGREVGMGQSGSKPEEREVEWAETI